MGTKATLLVSAICSFFFIQPILAYSTGEAKDAVTTAHSRVQAGLRTVSGLSSRPGIVPGEAKAIKICVGTIEDAIKMLQLSLDEFPLLEGGRAGSAAAAAALDNIKTFTRLAEVDHEVCITESNLPVVQIPLRREIQGTVYQVKNLIHEALQILNGIKL